MLPQLPHAARGRCAPSDPRTDGRGCAARHVEHSMDRTKNWNFPVCLCHGQPDFLGVAKDEHGSLEANAWLCHGAIVGQGWRPINEKDITKRYCATSLVGYKSIRARKAGLSKPTTIKRVEAASQVSGSRRDSLENPGADPNRVLAAVKRGKQKLESIH